jgi:hypothetical protein
MYYVVLPRSRIYLKNFAIDQLPPLLLGPLHLRGVQSGVLGIQHHSLLHPHPCPHLILLYQGDLPGGPAQKKVKRFWHHVHQKTLKASKFGCAYCAGMYLDMDNQQVLP